MSRRLMGLAQAGVPIGPGLRSHQAWIGLPPWLRGCERQDGIAQTAEQVARRSGVDPLSRSQCARWTRADWSDRRGSTAATVRQLQELRRQLQQPDAGKEADAAVQTIPASVLSWRFVRNIGRGTRGSGRRSYATRRGGDLRSSWRSIPGCLSPGPGHWYAIPV